MRKQMLSLIGTRGLTLFLLVSSLSVAPLSPSRKALTRQRDIQSAKSSGTTLHIPSTPMILGKG